MNYRARALGKEHAVALAADGTTPDGFARLRVRAGDGGERTAEARLDGDRLRLRIDGRVLDLWLDAGGGRESDFVTLGGDRIRVEVRRGGAAGGAGGADARLGRVQVASPMPGRIVAVRVAAGEAVAKGQLLFTLEAMKMQNEFVAPVSGRVASIGAAPGRVAAAGEVLAEIDPDAAEP